MKRPVKGIIISAFAFLVAVAGAGCYQQQSQGTKRTKLIAAENMRLKKELAELEKEIERLKQLNQEQLVEKQNRLNQCQKEKQAWQEKAQENIQNQVTGVLDVVMGDIKKLRQENERLKAMLERLTQHVGSNRSLREEVEKLKEQMEIKASPLEAP
jgi:cell shape-determining protein MreC